jgi:hypothetical protein
MSHPDDWTDLAEVWTAPEDAPELTAASVRRRAWLARLNFRFEAGGAVVAGLFGGGIALTQREPVLGVAALVFGAFALIATVWARRGVGPELTTTPGETLRAAVAQARSGLRWARAGQAITCAALLFVIAAVLDAGIATAAWLYGPVLLLLALCAVFYERHARRCRTRIARYEAALLELEP